MGLLTGDLFIMSLFLEFCSYRLPDDSGCESGAVFGSMRTVVLVEFGLRMLAHMGPPVFSHRSIERFQFLCQITMYLIHSSLGFLIILFCPGAENDGCAARLPDLPGQRPGCYFILFDPVEGMRVFLQNDIVIPAVLYIKAGLRFLRMLIKVPVGMRKHHHFAFVSVFCKKCLHLRRKVMFVCVAVADKKKSDLHLSSSYFRNQFPAVFSSNAIFSVMGLPVILRGFIGLILILIIILVIIELLVLVIREILRALVAVDIVLIVFFLLV